MKIFTEAIEEGIVIKTIKWAYALVIIAFLPAYILFSLELIKYPLSINIGEGLVTSVVRSLAEGNNIYDKARAMEPPFIFNLYNPGYYNVAAFFYDNSSPFISLRILQYCITLVICATILMAGKQYFGDAKKAVVLLFTFLSSFPLAIWLFYIRVDSLALLFSIAGLCVFLKNQGKENYLHLIFFLAAFITKQSAITYFIGITIYTIFVEKAHRKGIKSFLLFVLGAVAAIFFFTLIYGEGFLYHTVFLNTLPAYNVENAMYVSLATTVFNSILLLGLVASAFLVLGKSKRLLPFMVLVSFAISSLLSLKVGALDNYFIECFFLSSVVVIDTLFGRINSFKRLVFLLLFLIMVLPEQMINLQRLVSSSEELHSLDNFAILETAAVYKSVYSESSDIEILQGREILVNDRLTYNWGLVHGMIKHDYVAEKTSSGGFDAILSTRDLEFRKNLDSNMFNEAFLGAVNENYKYKKDMQIFYTGSKIYYIYEPVRNQCIKS